MFIKIVLMIIIVLMIKMIISRGRRKQRKTGRRGHGRRCSVRLCPPEPLGVPGRASLQSGKSKAQARITRHIQLLGTGRFMALILPRCCTNRLTGGTNGGSLHSDTLLTQHPLEMIAYTTLKLALILFKRAVRLS